MAASPAPAIAQTAGLTLQRKCDCGQHTVAGGACSDCEKKKGTLQRKTSTSEATSEVPPIVHDVLRSPGQPLDASTRAFMEPRFSHDFSRVRVHTDSRAAESAQAVNALAYTVESDVVFASGQYAPQITAGIQLLAHELTHVVQQNGHTAQSQDNLRIGPVDDSYEREADRFMGRVNVPGVKRVSSFSSPHEVRLQRKCKPSPDGSKFEWEVDYDGCSGPEGLPGKLLDLVLDRNNPARGEDTEFAEGIPSLLSEKACDRHDECYQTCHHGDHTQKEKCDDRMLEDMIDTCFEAEGKQSKKCFRWAKRYRLILKTLGTRAYDKRQGEVCRCGSTLLSLPAEGAKKRQ
jgi:hypothetical protein